MRLQGSCHCGAVTFSCESRHPYPFNRCYCSICRKTQGGGGFAVNLGGDAASLMVTGDAHITVYRAANPDFPDGLSPLERRFCKHCGSALYVWDARWPELLHPFASAIDTPLPTPPEHVHLMLEGKPDWVGVDAGPNDTTFPQYPDESIADWHARLGVEG